MNGVNGVNGESRYPGCLGTVVLLPRHLADLKSSGLSDDVIAACRFESVTDARAAQEVLGWKGGTEKLVPALRIPFFDHAGDLTPFARLKPDVPRVVNEDGEPKTVRYEQPKGESVRIYFPPPAFPLLGDPAQPLLITEGEKKAARGAQEGFACVGLTGVECWSAPRPKGLDGRKVGERQLHPDLAALPLQGRPVFVVFDSDASEKEEVRRAEQSLAEALRKAGADVRGVRLPVGTSGGKVGLDDYLCSHTAADLRALMAESLPAGEDPVDIFEAIDDPHRLARGFLRPAAGMAACPTPRQWRSEWYAWGGCCYQRIEEADVRAEVVAHVKSVFDQEYIRQVRKAEQLARDEGEDPAEARRKVKPVGKVTKNLNGNVLMALGSLANLPGNVEAPAWIAGEERWPADEVLVTPTALVHLPSLVSNQPGAVIDPTPTLFATSALGCPFDPDAPVPSAWLSFLAELWDDDPEAIEALQEWFGYCLTSDTSHQKILMIIGPKRSGKGTILRILRALLGASNTAAPTLSSLGGSFGLQPLLGKRLATITDARLSHRTDIAQVTEQLLSISGEDGKTVDRKHLPSVTLSRLPIKFVIVSNELPHLSDSSGALVGRLVILRQTRSWYGREDRALSSRLLPEMPSILLWGIRGWQRLRERGHFRQPKSANRLVAQMEDLSSPVGAFMRECCRVGAGFEVPCNDLFASWKGWCEGKSRKPGTEQVFGRDLRAVVPGLDTIRPRTEDGGRNRVYTGVRLKNETDEKDQEEDQTS